MTVWEFLTEHWPPFLPSTEGKQVYASKSEMRRWFERNSVHIDGAPAKMLTEVLPASSIILHPKSEKRRTTLQ